MSETKVRCSKCGVEILAATARRTGGICMPCRDGASPEWPRRQRWLKLGMDPRTGVPWHRSPWGSEILTTCRKLLYGELGCIKGSEEMVRFAADVHDGAHGDKWLHKDWEVFFTVTWAAEEMRHKTDELAGIENTHAAQVRRAALKLLEEAERAKDDLRSA